MSTNPNDPFQNPNAVGYEQAPPRQRSGKGCLIGCLVIGLLGVLVCCGGGFFAFQFGMTAMAEEMADQIQADPAIQEHIGEIESVNFSLSASIEEVQAAQDNGGEPGAVFELKGSKGTGRLILNNSDGADGVAILKLPDGTRYPVEMDPIDVEFNGVEEFDMEDITDDGELQSEDSDDPGVQVP